MDFSIEELIENIRVVDEERDYWFVRTYSGALFQDFYDRDYIGLGMNAVPMKFIKEASKHDEASYERLRSSIIHSYDMPLSEVTRWANQLIDFEKGVKIGDIVIIPSENSDKYAIGIVEGETKKTTSNRTFKFRDNYEQYPERRKKVKWLKVLEKDALNGELRNLSSTRMPLTNAYKYREIIEGLLSTVYINKGYLYLTIKINQEEDINAFAFSEFLSGLTFFYQEFAKHYGEEVNEDLYLKIKVQSKGVTALKTTAIAAGAAMFALIQLSNNANFKVNLADLIKLEGKSDGFLKSWTDMKKANQELEHREAKFQDSMKRLKANPVPESISPDDDHSSHLILDKDKGVVSLPEIKEADKRKVRIPQRVEESHPKSKTDSSEIDDSEENRRRKPRP